MAVEQLSRPVFAGAYPVSEASLYIRATMKEPISLQPPHRHALEAINTKHLHYWVKQGLAGRYLLGLRGDDVTLSFLDLISLRLIATMRAHGVPSKNIQIAHNVLRSKWGVTHPFAMEPIWVSGGDVFVKEGLGYLAVSKNWQMSFDFIDQYLIRLHGITFSKDRLAKTWEPSANILLDPSIQFGEPCLTGTRVATEVIWSFYCAGDSIAEISRMYGIKQSQIEAAIDWERKLSLARN